MTGPVTFGAFLSSHPPKEQFALVRRVEALGFDSVWCGDHVSFNHPLYESLTLLASYASITERIKLNPICDAPEERDQLELIAVEVLPRF